MQKGLIYASFLFSLTVCTRIYAYGTPRAATTVEFRFERENCSAGTFASWVGSTAPQALGTTVRDPNTSNCLRQNGLHANRGALGKPPLETTNGTTSLSDSLLGTTGFALEVWAQVDATAWSEIPLTDPSSSNPMNHLQLLVALQSDTGDYCTGIYLAREDSVTLEVVVYGYMQTYFEGEPACLPIVK